MPSVLQPSNAFPGIPFPQHLSGQSSVQNFRYPGAVQPLSTKPGVLSYTNAFPGIPFPNHLAGQSTPQSFVFPGAVQPQFVILLTGPVSYSGFVEGDW
jgi:hypothetical protein